MGQEHGSNGLPSCFARASFNSKVDYVLVANWLIFIVSALIMAVILHRELLLASNGRIVGNRVTNEKTPIDLSGVITQKDDGQEACAVHHKTLKTGKRHSSSRKHPTFVANVVGGNCLQSKDICWLQLPGRLHRLQRLHGWSRGQKNEQENNAPSPKKQCRCRLSGSTKNRGFER